ncbi:MAG: radical SAM protein [Candidatus Diapherotrites archaeon]|nr:radical SAM protein [Candidatus Diapherotrites archaeon]
MPEEIMRRHRCFDILVYGEGEITFAEIMQKFREAHYSTEKFLKDYRTLAKIRGIVFRNGKKIIMNAPQEPVQNLDELPFPARHLLPMRKYIPLPNQYLRLPVVHMLAIRGCPYNCTFCSNNAVFGRAIRARSPEKVLEEIRHLQEKYGAKEISFWDDMLTANRKWMEKFCSLLIENKIDITWTCYARVDTVDLPLLKLMKRAGCWNIFYGFESGNQQLLDNIGKRITLQQIRNASKWTKEAGIEIRASFMIALPGETPELAEQTLEFAKELNPDYVQFCITTPYPGTALYNDAKKYGKLTKDFDKFHGWDAVFIPKGYKNKEEILALEKKFFREFYLRPAYVLGRFAKIKSFRDLMRYAKGARFLLGFTS